MINRRQRLSLTTQNPTMITKVTTAQNIDLWEAWIDMHFHDQQATATLFVIGEVCVNNAILEPHFQKVTDMPGYEGRLVLQVVPNIISDEGLETEILYAEELQDVYQYSGVTVFVGSEVLVEIDNLECIF